MNPSGKLPDYVTLATKQLDAAGFNTMIAVARAVQLAKGGGGIEVKLTEGGLLISQRKTGGGGSKDVPFQWARVTAVGASTVTAKMMDSTGNVTGDPFTVNLYAGNATGVTLTPVVANLTPHLVVGSLLRIVQVKSLTTEDLLWWSIDTFVETCT